MNLGQESARCLAAGPGLSGFIHLGEVEDTEQGTLSCFVGTDCHNPHLPTLNTSGDDRL